MQIYLTKVFVDKGGICMEVMICYDVKDNKLRYRLVRYLEKMAVRVQYSVFKANLNKRQIKSLDSFAKRLLKNGEEGNLLIYEVKDEFSKNEQASLPKDYLIL